MRSVSRGARQAEAGQRRRSPLASPEFTIVVVTHCQYPLCFFVFFLDVQVIIPIVSAFKHLVVMIHGSKVVLDGDGGY